MKLDLHKRVPYKIPELIFATRGDAVACLEGENVVGDKKDVPKHCRTCWYGEPKFMTSGICDDCRRQWFLKGSPAHWRPLE